MPWLSSIERSGYKRGLEEGLEQGLEQGLERGLEKGLEKGREEGREEGERKGLLEGVILDLDTKFGRTGRKLLPKIRALSTLADLRQFAKSLKSAESLDEARKLLS